MKRQHSSAGFTLIEIMVASAIFLVATTLIWGSMSQTLRVRTELEAIETRYRGVRLTMARIARELSMAYLSKNETAGSVDPRTFFQVEPGLSGDTLSFSYMGHLRLYESADEADTAVVSYFVESDRDNPRRRNLYRRETRRIGQEDPSDKGAAYVACEDVEKFEIELYDFNNDEWLEQWDTSQLDGQPDRLPSRVRIRMVVVDERGREIPFYTEARVFLQDPIWFSPSS